MFTGIIETTGTVTRTERQGTNLQITMETPLAAELKIDQSVSHNGVCLTVTRQDATTFDVVAIDETLQKTNLGQLKPGSSVNLERAMVFNGRIDGHLVQGHVDGTGTCLSVTEQDGSWIYRIGFPPQFAALIVEKGSICLNGISLTVFNVRADEFTVAIIPYTHEFTNIKHLKAGDTVNLEFDILGKFVARHMELRK